MTRRTWLGPALLGLFVLSGFAGLIYQSIWSHYLGLTLGHAAYAQTLVLAIFMGGMAVGAWLVSRYGLRLRALILAYAVVELVIGVGGIAFHSIFVAYTGFSQLTVLPAMPGAGTAQAYQWLSAALLIAPQSVLLGATFPLMSAGFLRAVPGEDGRVLGGLYFTNSLGAALGVLAATFLLLPAVGMPGTVLTAGVLNVLVGIGAWAVSKALGESDARAARARPHPGLSPQAGEGVGASQAGEEGRSGDVQRLGRAMVAATFVSGAASFVYEIGWIRLLNQALGTTIHSFELMLAAFILGLAFGGLWVRRRSARIADPVRVAGFVQVWMGLAALVSIPLFAQSFSWVGWIMGAVSRTDSGYALFSLGSAAIALLVMFPAAFFAGMTLPLFTMALLRAGAGEASIGRIYAANTLGSILGVMLAVHVLIPFLGVQLAITLAALVDAAVGFVLLRTLLPNARVRRGLMAAGTATAAVLAFSLVLGRPDPQVQASGVFRTGNARTAAEIVYLRDGKTSTVAVARSGQNHMNISTNGKPDAAMTALDAEPTPDESTMVMLGLMPLVAHPAPERVALIGWGSGLSTHTVLGSPAPREVDTIEIEPAMVEAARLFGERVARAYDDPRSRLRIDDARTFFSTGAQRYDVIVSEPSNPWVSGVASLFTEEFYRLLHRHLEEDGVLVQWIHSYELDDALLATMMAAMVEVFPDSDVYIVNSADIIVMGYKGPRAPHSADAWTHEPLGTELRRVGLGSPAEIEARRLGGGSLLRAFARLYGVQPHSDFYPTVSLRAPRARFKGESANLLQALAGSGMPILDILEERLPAGSAAGLVPNRLVQMSIEHHLALATADSLRHARVRPTLLQQSLPVAESIASLLAYGCGPAQEDLALWSFGASIAATASLGHLPPEDLRGAWIEPAWCDSGSSPPIVRAVMAAYAAAAERDVATMATRARAALDDPDFGALAHGMREQMLILAMLGEIGQGNLTEVQDLEVRYATTVGGTSLLEMRAFLRAWADERMAQER